MKKATLLLLLFVCANASGAPQPKAAGTNLLDSVTAIRPVDDRSDSSGFYRLPAVTSADLPGHLTTADGSPLLLQRFSLPGATTLRLHIEDLHLPEGAALFAYTVDSAGLIVSEDGPVANGSDYWTPPLRGDTIFVEVDWQAEIPGDIPFRVTGLREAEPAEEPAFQNTGETQAGTFRGQAVTYALVAGLAVYEGDIVLGNAGLMNSAEPGRTKDLFSRDAVGITGDRYRWPGGTIPYLIPASMPSPARITDAIAHWNQQLASVIHFVPRTNEKNYVSFAVSSGCAGMVGMMGIGGQPLYLSGSCATGNVIHELGHAVGLWHEQSREDRDSHVKVLWPNILTNAAFNFNQNIWNGDDVNGYDFASIMHYGVYSFSSNGKPTLETIPAGIPIGQRTALSPGDIAGVRKMYGAPPVDPNPPPPPVPGTTVVVTLQTNPTGQTIRVDGISYTAPASITWDTGTVHNLEAVVPVTGSSILTFVRWSDGGARAHPVTATSTLTVLNADYAISYPVVVSTYPLQSGTVTLSPKSDTDAYPASTALSLNAVPNAGYCFSSWTGLLSGTPASTSVTVNTALNLVANFVPGSVTVSGQLRFSPGQGETFSVAINANATCGWSATSSASWITVASGAKGTGNGTVTLTVAPNTGHTTRVGVLVIGGRSYAVSQSST